LRDLPSDVPFVFLTSLTDQRDQMAVADMGISDYLSKPVTEEALRTCIARIIG
jgi:DNA-binding response OmpR family regulator